MKTNPGGAIEFFHSIPDDVLVKIALYDWRALESLCIALTLDLQLLREETEREKKNLAS
jgi:hypothetical protein